MFDKRKDSNEQAPKAHYDAGLNDAAASKTASNPSASGRAAVIGPKIRINGDVSGDENLLVEGQIDGKVILGEHRVDIGGTGKVSADIEARVIKVDGEVIGDISGSEKVIISNSGNVRGNIVAPRVSLEDGAKFKGSIDMDPGKAAAKPAKPAADAASANGSRPAEAPKSSNGQAPVPGKDKAGQEGLSLKSD